MDKHLDKATSLTEDPKRNYVLQCGRRYWPRGAERIASLRLHRADGLPALRVLPVRLPEWAGDLGVGSPSVLLVDAACVARGMVPNTADATG